MPGEVSCDCNNADCPHTRFDEVRRVGVDHTEGRFADVTILQCLSCDETWLHYSVEYEGFSKSGRWARGLIDVARAQNITPEHSVPYLDSLSSYLFGGSRYDGVGGSRAGPMDWAI
jgi:hypothetical protein